MTRTCSRCGLDKPLDEFYDHVREVAGRRQCKVCMGDVKRIYLFGITPERYAEMLSAQGGKCAICRGDETCTRNGRVIALAIDHDHSCCPGIGSCGKCVRALLCSACNRRLVIAESDWLPRAQAYLRTQQKANLKDLIEDK